MPDLRRLPSRADETTILFAHAAYNFTGAIGRHGPQYRSRFVRTIDDLMAGAADADVIVVSGLWRDAILDIAPRLSFVQSISAGTDQYGKDKFRAAGVRLASAQGVNAQAVAEHALALLLALTRQIHSGRDHQARRFWRPMIGEIGRREEVLAGKTLLIVGLGGIGQRISRLGKAFDMTVLATRRDPSKRVECVDELHPDSALIDLLPRADAVVLACPLTPATEKLIGHKALAAMKPDAYLVNVARGRVVDEGALIANLQAGRLAGAALDVTEVEPLAPESPLWDLANVLITPHTGGETRFYEEDVVRVLLDNIGRLQRGESQLHNQIV